jgi:hypothetical protein
MYIYYNSSLISFLNEMVHRKVVEKKHFFMLNDVFSSENRAVYETAWKNMLPAGQSTDDNIIRRMHSACWITKATNKDSEFVIELNRIAPKGRDQAVPMHIGRA